MSPTEVFRLYNKDLGGYLSITNRNINDIFYSRDIVTCGDNISKEKQEMLNFKSKFNSISPTLVNQTEHRLCLEVTENPSFNTLFEIQRDEIFDPSPISFNSNFKIKNISSDLFVTVEDQKLLLKNINNIDEEASYFKFKSKISSSKDNYPKIKD